MLEGIKVLSFTHFLQGPSAVQMLADLGADVVKVESPSGAFERQWAGLDAYINGISVFFLLGNRNQRSISINLRPEGGKEIIYRLIRETDVLVENFRPGVMERLGFGYEKLKELNPRLVYCSISGYGSDGPYLQRPGQDLLAQSMSGLATLNGGKGSPPTPVGASVVDQHGAVLAAFGIMAALYDREKTGLGHKIESNLLNAALDLQIEPLTYHLNKGSLWERSSTGIGSRYHESPYGVFETHDGWITISLTPIDKLAKALKSAELEQYSIDDQKDKREEVNGIIVKEIKKKSTNEWYSILAEHDIWYAPVNDYEDVEKDPQVEWNKMIMTLEHPDAGKVRLLSHPLRYDGETPTVRQYPPRLGEHTEMVLTEIGYSEAGIQKLIDSGVVAVYQGK
ncbi:MAG: CaiB/BaiF CoA transferase family protein [Desulfitobacteriaceae bacterium]